MLCVRQVDLAEDRMKIDVQATRKNLTLIGMLDGPRDRFELMLALYEKHKIKPVIDRVFKFDGAEGGTAVSLERASIWQDCFESKPPTATI